MKTFTGLFVGSLIAFAGSTASYAQEIVVGDMNDDNVLTIDDVTLLTNTILGRQEARRVNTRINEERAQNWSETVARRLKSTAEGLIKSADQFKSPYSDPEEGSVEALFDGNPETFWHSNWHDGNIPLGTHYFDIDLLQAMDGYLMLSLTRRLHPDNHITALRVEGSNDKSTWTDIEYLNIPYEKSGEERAAFFELADSYRYLRFYIMDTASSVPLHNGFNHMSELRLYKAEMTSYEIGLIQTLKRQEAAERELQQIYETAAHDTSADDYTVDLGLPSGTLWATANVGAWSPEEDGVFVSWGKTYCVVGWNNYYFGNYTNEAGTTELNLADDAAFCHWGEKWCTPSLAQYEELLACCEWELTTLRGVTGAMGRSLKNGESIFFPFAGNSYSQGRNVYGWYWARNLDLGNEKAFGPVFGDGETRLASHNRPDGLPVRAVRYVPISAVTLSASEATLNTGDGLTLTAIVAPQSAAFSTCAWSSSDPTVARVSPYGEVAAIGPGNAVITATANDNSGVSATCDVTVRQLVTSIELAESLTIAYDQYATLTATVLPATAYNREVTWTSSKPNIVRVDADGRVYGASYGTSVVTATAKDGSGVTAQCVVTVSSAL